MTVYSRLREEIKMVRTPGFHVVEGPESPSWESLRSQSHTLPASYVAFVKEFGRARLYRIRKDTYALGVVAPPAPAKHKSGPLLRIGHSDESNAYFNESDLRGSSEAPIYEWGAGGLRRVADSFVDWIDRRMREARKRIEGRQWLEAVAGPQGFTDREREIVVARRGFEWRTVGVSDEGDVLFEVTNRSSRVLPYLSIGVRSKSGSLAGAVWVPVGAVPPGGSSVIAKGVYKKLVSPGDLEFYALPDPEPQDRADYWEFRALGGVTSGCRGPNLAVKKKRAAKKKPVPKKKPKP